MKFPIFTALASKNKAKLYTAKTPIIKIVAETFNFLFNKLNILIYRLIIHQYFKISVENIP